MKRVLGILTGACLALAIGCAQSYDIRLQKAIDRAKYDRDLKNNTENPPTGSNLQTKQIYIRAPKGLHLAKTFAYNVEPGKFNISDSFINTETQVSMHVLALTPEKAAAAKKGAPKPAEAGEGAEAPPATTANPANFTTDVIDFIKATYSTDFDASKLKTIEPTSFAGKSVTYKGAKIEAGEKELQVYFHGDKNGPAQVALIFEGTKDALNKISTRINYSLNSLRVGPRAAGFYSGQDDLGGEEPAAPPTGVF